jgi:hypothetical protein
MLKYSLECPQLTREPFYPFYNAAGPLFLPQHHHAIMRVSPRLLAVHTNAGATTGLKPAPLALLPPLPLYRRLFRTHRKFLPREMRLLGDEYIKSEFRKHRNAENPLHIVRALSGARI